MDSSAPEAGAPLGSGLQGPEDCLRRIDLINAERKLRGLPVRDYHNDRKALTRLMLRFEILSSEIRFLRSLEYAPPDAALTTSAAATTIASASFAGTSVAAAAAAVSTTVLTSAPTTSTALDHWKKSPHRSAAPTSHPTCAGLSKKDMLSALKDREHEHLKRVGKAPVTKAPALPPPPPEEEEDDDEGPASSGFRQL